MRPEGGGMKTRGGRPAGRSGGGGPTGSGCRPARRPSTDVVIYTVKAAGWCALPPQPASNTPSPTLN